MTKTDRFQNLAAFRAEKDRLKAKRDLHAEGVERHLVALKDGDFRTKLLKNSATALWGAFTPTKMLGSILSSGGIGSAIGMATGTGKGGLLKRAGLFALGLAAPRILEKVEAISLPDIGRELSVSWERWKNHRDERRAQRMMENSKDSADTPK